MEVAQETSTEQNTSMEELKMDEDDNVKETSMEEDILGAQSLLMSESDDEGNGNTSKNSNKSPLKKISPKRTKRILDSDDEGEANKEEQHKEQEDDKIEIEKEQEVEDDDEEVVNRTIKKKILALIDSDSDNDETESHTETSLKPNKTSKGLIDSESENDPESTQTPKNDNSDTENQKTSKKLNKKSKKLKKLSLSDNSDSENSDSEESMKAQKKSKKSKKKDGSNSESSESEDKALNKKVSSLVDSESDTDSKSGNNSDMDLDAAARAANFEGNNNDDEAKGKNKKTKVMRASAKKALDDMQAIQSEQQRLHREAHISIPYHKPKKHTLQEFLKRRTIIQPQLSPQSGSPASAVGQMRRIKMTAEEMEEYAKLMEERAKEAKEFFKSESEGEDDKIFKDNPGVLDKQTEQDNVESEEEIFKDNEGVFDKPTEQQSEPFESVPQETTEFHKDAEMEEVTNTPDTNIANEVKDQREGVYLTDAELEELLAEERVEMQEDERPTCSKVLITEVIELPKLDMNTVKISPVKKHTPRTSLNIKQLLKVKNLADSPSLSGDPNKLIDLETGDLIEKKPTGIENLMQRLMSSVKARKSKTSETCNILSTENGKLEMTTVNVSLTETKDKNKEPKPGAAYFELKKNLKEIIKKKRMEEMHKKQEEELEYSKCLADDDDEEEVEDEEYEPDAKPKNKTIVVDDEENAVEVDEDDDEEENEDEDDDDDENLDNENDTENVKDVKNVDDNTEDKNENDDDEDDEDEDEDSDEEEEEKETTDATKRKNRIIKAFDDSDDDDLDFLKTPQLPLQTITFDTQSSEKISLEDKENELMALCSGTFETQKSAANALMSQIPLTQNTGKLANDEELMELCSGTFETQPSLETQMETQTLEHVENLKPATNKILSSDEEDELENNKGDSTRVKKLTKKLKKKKAKLGFSDDEDEDDDNEDEEENDNIQADDDEEEENEVLESAVEEPETFVDYDSEENEILVQMTKKDKLKQAANFFEKEAELSESEWGSADEDEKHMDKYDIELGDEDEFDREKLQAELGQIHARKMLDDDLREVRKIQDMLFEDEEKDGVGRQRTFKWKNAESGFSLDDGPRDENADGQNGDSGDEMNEHQWRKLRYEREQFLKEQGLKPGSQDMSTTLPNTTMSSINNTTNATTTTKKLQIITAKKTSVSTSNSKKSSPFLISKGISTMHKKSVRGSFLIRDKETLNKLAGLTKGQSSVNASDMENTAGTVSLKSIKAKNFVFATLTEEEHENIKRKADDLLNSSTENGTNFMKKPKIEPRRDKCFIDQLL